MLGKLKFKLLGWLLGDICEKSGDDDFEYTEENVDDPELLELIRLENENS